LDVEGRIYVLSDNIVNNELTDDCIKITAPGITLDCDDGAGGRYSIKSDDAYIGVFSNQPNTVVKNCEISMSGTDWVDSPVPPMFGYWISGYGIKLEYGADGSKIINNDLSGQSYGISIEGVSSGDKINNLVIKDNRMNVNEVNGISIENVLNVEVENNEVCGNEGVSIFCFGATGVSFVEDNKCDSNTCGGLSCEPCPECVITKLYWSQSEIISKGERVDLVIEGESCEGIEIENVEVFEEDSEIGFLSDIFNPDDVVLKNPSVEGVVFSGGEARVTWTAEFQEDEVGGPEYYFKVIVDGETYTSSKVAGEMLEVQAVDRGTQEGRTITLSPGKNLISIPLILDSMSVEGVFSGISGVEKIYAYDEEWEIYHFDGKPSNLVSLEPGKGYVVVMAENAEVVDLNILGYKRTVEKTLPTIKLKKGWNFIGTFALAEEVGADVLFREIQDYDLYEWDDTTKGYVLVGKEIVLDETKSYWIFVRDEIEEVDISPIVRLAPEDE